MNPSNLQTNQDKTGLHGYLCQYKTKNFEVWTNKGSYAAQNIACDFFKVPKNKGYMILVNLCVKPDSQEVIHTASE